MVRIVSADDLRHDRQHRHIADPAAGQFRQPLLVRAAAPGDLGECGNGPALEHIPGREDHTAGFCPRHQLNRQNAVSAEREERIVHADPRDAQDVGEDLADDRLDLTHRGAERLRLQHRFR